MAELIVLFGIFVVVPVVAVFLSLLAAGLISFDGNEEKK